MLKMVAFNLPCELNRVCLLTCAIHFGVGFYGSEKNSLTSRAENDHTTSLVEVQRDKNAFDIITNP